jgi:hypothetical protein
LFTDEGFVADEGGGYCYYAFPDLKTFEDGKKDCQDQFLAEMVNFDLNNEVLNITKLLTFFSLILTLQKNKLECFSNIFKEGSGLDTSRCSISVQLRHIR